MVPSPSKKIGGILYLIAIAMIFNPMLNAVYFLHFINTANNSTLTSLFDYGYAYSLLVILTFVINCYMLIGSILVSGLFFDRNRRFPKAFVIYFAVLFLLCVLNCFIMSLATSISYKAVNESITFATTIFSVCLIWIPYFLISKRVKRTFVR